MSAAPMMQIGAVVDRESVMAVADAIVKVLSQPGDQKTIRHAISALQMMSKVENVSISGCTFGDRTIQIDAADHEVLDNR